MLVVTFHRKVFAKSFSFTANFMASFQKFVRIALRNDEKKKPTRNLLGKVYSELIVTVLSTGASKV